MFDIETAQNNLTHYIRVRDVADSYSLFMDGVGKYIDDLIEEYGERISENNRPAKDEAEFEKWLLNGASNWREYAMFSSLVYDDDIKMRTMWSYRAELPKGYETWHDLQYVYLLKAKEILIGVFRKAKEDEENV